MAAIPDLPDIGPLVEYTLRVAEDLRSLHDAYYFADELRALETVVADVGNTTRQSFGHLHGDLKCCDIILRDGLQDGHARFETLNKSFVQLREDTSAISDTIRNDIIPGHPTFQYHHVFSLLMIVNFPEEDLKSLLRTVSITSILRKHPTFRRHLTADRQRLDQCAAGTPTLHSLDEIEELRHKYLKFRNNLRISERITKNHLGTWTNPWSQWSKSKENIPRSEDLTVVDTTSIWWCRDYKSGFFIKLDSRSNPLSVAGNNHHEEVLPLLLKHDSHFNTFQEFPYAQLADGLKCTLTETASFEAARSRVSWRRLAMNSLPHADLPACSKRDRIMTMWWESQKIGNRRVYRLRGLLMMNPDDDDNDTQFGFRRGVNRKSEDIPNANGYLKIASHSEQSLEIQPDLPYRHEEQKRVAASTIATWRAAVLATCSIRTFSPDQGMTFPWEEVRPDLDLVCKLGRICSAIG